MGKEERISIKRAREYLEFEDHVNDIFVDFISSLREKGLTSREICSIFFGVRANWVLTFDRNSKSFFKGTRSTTYSNVSLNKKIQYLVCAGYQFEIFVKKPHSMMKIQPKIKSSIVKEPSAAR